MNENFYTITLSDGTVIENLILNGNNFISNQDITPEIFKNNLSPVIINDGVKNEIHDNMILVQITEINEKKAFILRDVSEAEFNDLKNRADIEYIAMMMDIDL